jgi:preprotein translocase subunit SecB
MTNDKDIETPLKTTAPKMKILNQFIKDLSFENIAAQNGISDQNVKPDIKVSIGLEGKKRPVKDQYDLIIKVSISSKTGGSGEVIFLLELEYGGIFEITNIDSEQLQPYLLVECPRIMFPYLRRIISDVTSDGGYPPLSLEQIDFLSMYQAGVERKAIKNSKIN